MWHCTSTKVKSRWGQSMRRDHVGASTKYMWICTCVWILQVDGNSNQLAAVPPAGNFHGSRSFISPDQWGITWLICLQLKCESAKTPVRFQSTKTLVRFPRCRCKCESAWSEVGLLVSRGRGACNAQQSPVPISLVFEEDSVGEVDRAQHRPVKGNSLQRQDQDLPDPEVAKF